MSDSQQLHRDTDPIVGIDLGTTNSLVAWCDASGPRLLCDAQGRRSLPSVVRFDEQGKLQAIGDAARRHAAEYPERTIFSIKRLMGRGLEDVRDQLAYLPYRVVQGDHQTARVQVGDTILSPQEISAILLRHLKERAEQALGCPVRKAVVTVPAYFDDAQRQATRDAGRLAGLEVLRIVNEPTAAALAYDLAGDRPKNHSDSASSDTSSTATTGLNISGGSGGTGGAGGGKDMTGGRGSGVVRRGDVHLNTRHNPQACTSHTDHTEGDTAGEPGSLHGAFPGAGGLSGAGAEAGSTIAVYDLGGGTFDISILHLEQTEHGMVDQVLATAGDTHLGGDDIDQAIIALIQQEIRSQFGMDLQFPPSTQQALRQFAEAAKIHLSDHPQTEIQVQLSDEQVYRRTLTQAQLQEMVTPLIQRTLDCCTLALKKANLSIDRIDRVILVGGSTRIPMVRQAVSEFFQTDPYIALNPEEVVALGASVQAAILAGIHKDRLLLDVLPLSLGIETLGGAVAKLIMAGSTLPARATEMFTTHVEGQTNVKIHVLQGERELVKDCRSLGEFDLQGIPPMPAGLPKINVTFLVDANGILSVTAVEERSGRTARIQVIPNHGLTRQEVEQMEAESIAHAVGDMTAHQLIDLRNQARLDIRAITKQLDRVGDQLSDEERQTIKRNMQTVEQFVASSNPEAAAFHAALDAMDKSSIRLAELAIKQTLSENG